MLFRSDRVYDLLRQHKVAFCIHDWREMGWPMEITADFTYIRFHGAGQCYGGNYPSDVLRRWAARLREWGDKVRHAYVYFNNDIGGHAVRNARELKQTLGQGDSRRGLSGSAIAA